MDLTIGEYERPEVRGLATFGCFNSGGSNAGGRCLGNGAAVFVDVAPSRYRLSCLPEDSCEPDSQAHTSSVSFQCDALQLEKAYQLGESRVSPENPRPPNAEHPRTSFRSTPRPTSRCHQRHIGREFVRGGSAGSRTLELVLSQSELGQLMFHSFGISDWADCKSN